MHRRTFLRSCVFTAPALVGACASRAAFSSTLELSAPGLSASVLHAPAEEQPHAATWMAWPGDTEIYGDAAYFESVKEHLARLARAIARFEPVRMLARPALIDEVTALCGERVQPVPVPANDMWIRDSGPVFALTSGTALCGIDFNFNAWGGKQNPHDDDSQIARRLCAYLGVPRIETSLVGEGGGLEYDGDGTVLLTDSCWLNDNRNPGMSRAEVTAELRRLLGVEKLIWLPGVKDRDITDGHIDGALRFVRPGLVMTGGYPSDDSIWGDTLRESRAILRRETDARGRSFELVDIPSATDPQNPSDDLFTGYANYYVGNGAIFTPHFGDRRADAIAAKRFGQLYPDREVVALSVDRIYENGGGIHCVTQQQPLIASTP